MPRLTFLFVLFIAAVSCKKEGGNCFKPAKNDVTVSRTLEAFNEIEIYDNPFVDFVNDTVYKAEIRFSEELMSGVDLQVKDEVLLIDNLNACRWLKDLSIRPKITIHMPLQRIQVLRHYGAEDVTFKDTITSNEFIYEQWDAASDVAILFSGNRLLVKQNTGPGTVTIHGNCNYLYVYNTSLGFTDASQMEAKTGTLISKSLREITANVVENCDVEIFGIGGVTVCPKPTNVKLRQVGSGELSFCN